MSSEYKDLMRHRRFDTPAYVLRVDEHPRIKGKGKETYKKAVRQAAQECICTPIVEDDVEVEINYPTNVPKDVRADIDNIIKPTLDALKGVAYQDDNQVRSVTSTLFDLTKDHTVSGRVEHMGPLLFLREFKILVAIYSDSRLQELGGEKTVKRQRFEDWERHLPQ